MIAFQPGSGPAVRSVARADVEFAAMSDIQDLLEQVARQDGGRLLAALIARFRVFELAEDCLQDAYAAALTVWARKGPPENPAGWLMTTARNRAIDRVRRAGRLQGKLAELAGDPAARTTGRDPATSETFPDERLKLIFTCCHPALSLEAQVALTLRTLGGLSTEDIARAFLVPVPTLAQRLVRAKAKISRAGIPFCVPERDQLAERTQAVTAVIYLIFNEGYQARAGASLGRADLSQEAIRLGQVLADLLALEGGTEPLPEALGLLALMKLHDSRRASRLDPDGELVRLEDQDREAWDPALIRAGLADLERALLMDRIGPYQLQAAISAVHVRAQDYASTDWHEIVALYTALNAVAPSPVVQLNRAVAVGMAHGPDAGLAALQPLAGEPMLRRYAPYHAARADILRRLGQVGNAQRAYQRALEFTENEVERRFLRRRLAELPAASQRGSATHQGS
jgi:RNA polymerase sigma-70 factor (ECF subfamily)